MVEIDKYSMGYQSVQILLYANHHKQRYYNHTVQEVSNFVNLNTYVFQYYSTHIALAICNLHGQSHVT